MIVVYADQEDRQVGDVPCGLVVMSVKEYQILTRGRDVTKVNSWLKSNGILGKWNSFGYSDLTVDGKVYSGLGFYVQSEDRASPFHTPRG